ncbi:MAG: hypothetical protein C4308_11695 [Chitinophagaceae bacterium]
MIAGVFLASCSPGKKSAASTSNLSQTTQTSANNQTARDGSSFETAIIIEEKTEGPGVKAEYTWLRENYPGYTLIRQSLSHKDGRHYDVMEIETKNHERNTIYFNITNFFAKW